MFTKEGGIFMPLWEKLLVLIIVAFSISSIFVVLSRSNKIDVNPHIILRTQWSAQSPRGKLQKLSILPPPYVIISHSVQRPCFDYVRCKKSVQLIQEHHMESLHFADIGYNFMVGGDGNVYEGRGWDKKGAHAKLFNNRSIGLSFIGDFRTVEPVPEQILAAKNFIEFGVKTGKIRADYKLLGHRQVSATESPGERLYRIIQTWDHWSAIP